MEVNGDFYDIVLYLANLFSKKRLGEVEISGYNVTYRSFKFRPSKEVPLQSSKEFPSDDQVEKVEQVDLEVSGISSSAVSVSISWNRYLFVPDIGKVESEKFIDSMDSSTFRYF